MKIKCNGQDILSNNFTDKDKKKLDSVQFCANNYKHPIRDGYKHLPAGGQEGQVVIHDGTNATWKYPLEIFSNRDDLFAYGVQFDTTIADPHLTRIGNLSMHKTLPIQSQLKGCIAKGGKVQYWLDKDDWRFREDHYTIPKDSYMRPTLSIAEGIYTIKCYDLTKNRNEYEKQWIKIDSVICQIDEIDDVNYTATLVYNEKLATLKEGLVDLELGSVLNGYDGTVRVYCPEFYIKSIVKGTVCKVFITQYNIDDTYTYQPAVLIDAYKSTVLNTVPEDMGYLSTLPVNSAVSVVNNNTYCRGGENRSDYDIYLEIDLFRTDLAKPRTYIGRSNMRIYSRNANSEVLSYDQYKNIFYWLYVIEYANFNCKEPYNETLTNDGYKQGGLGPGIANTDRRYNNYNPVTPCGYGNDIGNNTGIKNLIIPEFTCTYISLEVDRYVRENSVANIVDSTNNGVTITKVIQAPRYIALRQYSSNVFGENVYKISGLTDGQTISFFEKRNNVATEIATASVDGSITVNWSDRGVNGDRFISFGKVQDECNITIYASSRDIQYEIIQQQKKQMPRWRGFDNPFGDIGIRLDGIIVNQKDVYTCQDANNYSESLNDSYERIASLPEESGYIKSFHLWKAAHIIPEDVGGNPTTYMCSRYSINVYSGLHEFTVGDSAICSIEVVLGANESKSSIGFRSVSAFIPSNN